ncbi:redoxin domain-containing protein [Aegicerativicinus sediminis]
MKTLKIYFPIIIAILMFGCQQSDTNQSDSGKELGNLFISKEKPQPGDSLTLKYSGESDKLNALYYYYAGNNFYPVDLEFSSSEGVNSSRFKIPDSARFIAFVYKNGEEYDTNENSGYLIPLYDENGELLSGSMGDVATYYARYGEQQGLEIEQDTILSIYEKEIARNSDKLESWYNTYLQMLNMKDKQKGKKLIQEKLAVYNSQSELPESELSQMAFLYQLVGEDSLATEVRNSAISKYPSGNFAFSEFYQKLNAEKDVDKKEAMYLENKTRFTDSRQKATIIRVLAMSYANSGKFEKFEEIMTEMPDDDSQKASIYNSVAWPMAEKGENLDFASKVSKQSLNVIEKAKGFTENKPIYMTESQYKQNLDAQYNMFADTYALISYKQGNYKEAVEYQKQAVGEGNNADINERYIQFLVADKQYKIAEEAAMEFISEDQSTAKIKDYFKEAYVANNGSEQGFKEVLDSLEKKAEEKAIAKLRKEIIDEEAPKFNLLNLEGKEVALNDFEGKILIIDFWATWCGPCIASFPGMQMAVNKYKDDPNVEFVFIDSWESFSPEKREKEVRNFIESNKYTFNVLMDTPVEEGSRSYEVIEDYKVKGIPTKFIVGPDGRIKFKAIGFMGSDEGIVHELDRMINLIREDVSP